jgi:hypothetical protein
MTFLNSIVTCFAGDALVLLAIATCLDRDRKPWRSYWVGLSLLMVSLSIVALLLNV